MMRVVSGSAKWIVLFEVGKNTTRSITSRIKTSLFDKLQPYFIDDPILDLYSGTGSMGIEALSRGASHCTFVDRDSDCIEVIQKNLKKTELDKLSKVYQSSVTKFLENKQNEKFKIIFYDPPFPLVKDNYDSIAKEISLMSDHMLDDSAVVFRHPKWLFQDVDGFEVLSQKEYGVSEITFLVKAESNG